MAPAAGCSASLRKASSYASLLVTADIGGLAILNEMRIHPLFSAIDQGTAMITFGILVALAVRAHAASGGPIHAR